MAAVESPFRPAYGTGATVTAAAASASATLGGGYTQLQLTNLSANAIYVRTGASSATATAADYLLPPGVPVVITVPPGHDKLAYISAVGGDFNYIQGEGW